MLTFEEVLTRAGVTIPPELEAQVAVPVLSDPQRQGDVFILPIDRFSVGTWEPVSQDGTVVVRGEATGNTHVLHAEGPARWKPTPQTDASVMLGELEVPEGSTAYLIHTDEHGANGIAPGSYRLHGKREQADEIRRVAD